MIAVEYDNLNFLRVKKDSTFYFSLALVTSSTSDTMLAMLILPYHKLPLLLPHGSKRECALYDPHWMWTYYIMSTAYRNNKISISVFAYPDLSEHFLI
jgi:hypothetical protein